MGGSRGSLKNHKNIGFLCNSGPDPLKNHKVTKSAFNVGPSSARQRWRADDGPINPDEIPHNAAFHLDLHCLPKYPLVHMTIIQSVLDILLHLRLTDN